MYKKRKSMNLHNSVETETQQNNKSDSKQEIANKIDIRNQLLKPIKIHTTSSSSLSQLAINNSKNHRENNYSGGLEYPSINSEKTSNVYNNSKYGL